LVERRSNRRNDKDKGEIVSAITVVEAIVGSDKIVYSASLMSIVFHSAVAVAEVVSFARLRLGWWLRMDSERLPSLSSAAIGFGLFPFLFLIFWKTSKPKDI